MVRSVEYVGISLLEYVEVCECVSVSFRDIGDRNVWSVFVECLGMSVSECV